MKAVEPTKSEGKELGGSKRDVFNHEAFGVITLTELTGGKEELFGSDLYHNSRLQLTISTAKLERSLSKDWVFAKDQVVRLSMSHAQFSSFITSMGKGGGTPVTLSYYNGKSVPGIKRLESKAETIQREIEESVRQQLEGLKKIVDEFGAKLATGKLGIKEARELHHSLKVVTGNLPGNTAFVVEQGREAIAAAQNAAKIDIEAYIDHAVHRIGLESIEQLAQLSGNPSSEALEE